MLALRINAARRIGIEGGLFRPPCRLESGDRFRRQRLQLAHGIQACTGRFLALEHKVTMEVIVVLFAIMEMVWSQHDRKHGHVGAELSTSTWYSRGSSCVLQTHLLSVHV